MLPSINNVIIIIIIIIIIITMNSDAAKLYKLSKNLDAKFKLSLIVKMPINNLYTKLKIHKRNFGEFIKIINVAEIGRNYHLRIAFNTHNRRVVTSKKV